MLSTVNPKLAAKEAFRLFCTPPMRYGGASLSGGEELSFQLAGLRIHGNRFNHPRSKKAMVLHGFSSASGNFADYVSELSEREFEVLAFDAPAHGKSEGKQVNALDYMNLIVEAVNRYGPVDVFIAHSFGGLALALALEKIEHSPEIKVVLIAPATETTSALKQALQMIGLSNSKLFSAVKDEIKNISGQEASWFSIRRAISNIQAKILWVHDEEDDITPLSDVLPVKNDNPVNVEFLFTKGLGHRKIYRSGHVKDRIYRFIGGAQ